MDNAGFLIMHEDFLLSSAKAADVEYVHITEKEKNIAEHLISRGYLKRKECRNLKDIRKQSFYEVDLPDGLVDVLQSGGSCSKYQLSQISGTNAYIGVAVRDSFCAAESCSCSSDNKCSYLSPKCECPCTSPLKFNYCRSQFPNSSLPICPPSVPDIDAPSNPSPPVPRKNCDKPGLEKCFDPHCSQRNSSQTCEGIASCFWCQYNKDDVPLTRPYCASSEVCFRGKEAEEKPNCGVTNQPSVRSPLKDRNWFSKLSTGAVAGFISGCIVFVAVIAVACILASRHLRNSKNTGVPNPSDPSDSDLANRPPAPLPKPAVPYVPEEQYEDPDELDRSRQSSVASIQWPSPYEEIRVRSNNKPLRIPLQERPHVIPPPPRLLQSSSGTVEPYGSTPPPQLLQDRKISLDSAPSPSNFPHSSVSRVETYGAGQPPVPNTTNAPEGASPQSHLRGVPGDNPPPTQLRKISGTNPPPLHQISNDGSLNSQNTTQSSSGGPPELPKKQRTFVGPRSSPIIICGEQDTCSDDQLRAAEENTTSDHDASPSSNSFQGADQTAYYNLPPPLPEPRKDADGYMMPCIGPSQLTSNDNSTSLDSYGYLKCIF